jgi:peptidoglycan/xylan/chitin deacetylase (PgdA/CDA1 family)
VLSLRFDDGYATDYSVIYPLLVARGLKAGFSIIRDKIDSTPTYLSLAHILEMQTNGIEMMCHSYTHTADPTTNDSAWWNYEVVTALQEELALGLNIDTFVFPGTWYPPGYYYSYMNSLAFFGTAEDSMIRQNYWAWEGYLQDSDRTLPTIGNYRMGDTGDTRSLSYLTARIDTLIASSNHGFEELFHSPNIDAGGGNISLADFTAYLDYIALKVAAGLLVVLTPTQQLFAVPA